MSRAIRFIGLKQKKGRIFQMSESRLFQIVYHLLIKGESTVSEPVEKFEVSTRTIYRDIDKLSCAGIPVYTATGYKGGIRLTDGFVLEKSVLPKEDMQNILTGVQRRIRCSKWNYGLPKKRCTAYTTCSANTRLLIPGTASLAKPSCRKTNGCTAS